MDSESNQFERKQERLRTRWTASQDKLFADLVVEQIQLGNRSNNGFDQKAWKYIRDQFNAQTGLNFNKKQLRKHLDVLRTRYYNLKPTFEQSGFYLEQSSHMIMPEFELLEDLTEEHIKPEILKIKDCHIYDQLCLIFNEPGLDGRYAQSSHYEGLDKKVEAAENTGSKSSPISTSMLVGSVAQTMPGQDNASSSAASVKGNVLANGRKKRPSGTHLSPQHHAKDQESLNGIIAKAMLDMISASKLREVARTYHDNQFSITNCIKALDEIEGIDQSLYFAALDLFDNSSQREIFLSLNCEKRLAWLQGKCKNFSPYFSGLMQ